MSSVVGAKLSHAAAEWSNEQLDLAGRLSGDLEELDDFAHEFNARAGTAQSDGGSGFLPRRINSDKATVEKDLARLVLALIDLIRRLMERQAVRRVNAGVLSEDEIEAMGETFLKLDQKMTELTTLFGLKAEDLNLNLGSGRSWSHE